MIRQSTKYDFRIAIAAILLSWVMSLLPTTQQNLELVAAIGKWCKESM